MLKLKATALAQQQFKARVRVAFPTNDVTAEGETKYGHAEFIGHFRAVPVDAARADMEKIKEFRDAGDHTGMISIEVNRVEKCFIGFEPVPGKELPFVDDNDQPLASTPEGIKLLLNIREVRDAVRKAFDTARSADVLEKNLPK